MTEESTIDKLNERINALIDHAYVLMTHIQCHEFSLASEKAAYIARWCNETNILANRIADMDNST
jgi:hypothetical protein